MHLEIGDIIDFDNILGGVNPYGIDYTASNIYNGQLFYKNFQILSTNKTLESCEIECIQLHYLNTEGLPSGCMDEAACNFQSNAQIDDGSCLYEADYPECWVDEDGDGQGSGIPEQFCSEICPEGYAPIGGDDCDDGTSKDCNGDCGGDAEMDHCGNCVGGNTGLEACEQDCYGTWGGRAYENQCGICVDGLTGNEIDTGLYECCFTGEGEPNQIVCDPDECGDRYQCADGTYGCDECGVCDGDGTSCDECVEIDPSLPCGSVETGCLPLGLCGDCNSTMSVENCQEPDIDADIMQISAFGSTTSPSSDLFNYPETLNVAQGMSIQLQFDDFTEVNGQYVYTAKNDWKVTWNTSSLPANLTITDIKYKFDLPTFQPILTHYGATIDTGSLSDYVDHTGSLVNNVATIIKEGEELLRITFDEVPNQPIEFYFDLDVQYKISSNIPLTDVENHWYIINEYTFNRKVRMPINASFVEGCSGVIGDAVGDGIVNILDIVATVNHIINYDSGDQALTGCSFENVDFNGDETINILEVVNQVNIIVSGV